MALSTASVERITIFDHPISNKGISSTSEDYMARSDWWYPNIPKKQADALDAIVKKEALKYGIIDKGELVRFIIADFVTKYEQKHGLIEAIKSVDFPQKNDTRN